jgi:hypothetical protein
VALIGLLLLSISMFFSLAVIWPRIWNKTSIGLIFWESIARHRSAQDRSTAIAEHLFILSALAKRKYLWVKFALWLGVPGAGLTAIALFLQHALKL